MTHAVRLESLEGRTLLSFWQQGDTFFIRGTDGADRIEVIIGREAATGSVVTQVYVNGELHDIAPVLRDGRYTKLVVRPGHGDDRVDVTTHGVLRTTVRGGGGDDVLASGFGVARLYGGPGNDLLRQHNFESEDDQDRVSFNDRPGFAAGGAGDDTIEGSGGPDLLRGGPGDDRVFGGDEGPDTLFGGSGRDVLDCSGERGCEAGGGSGGDTLIGSRGPDRLVGRRGADYIVGAERDDTLIGGSGRDRMYGGTGDDLLLARDGSPRDVLDGGGGNDRATLDQFCLPGWERLFDTLLMVERGACVAD